MKNRRGRPGVVKKVKDGRRRHGKCGGPVVCAGQCAFRGRRFRDGVDASRSEMGDFFDARRHPVNDGEVEGRELRRLEWRGRCPFLCWLVRAQMLARLR